MVTSDNGTARYRKGVMEVRLPKVSASTSARIRVQDY
jgi:HSP20 family molecular chaperone IbpA